jgi:hypothetical protein
MFLAFIGACIAHIGTYAAQVRAETAPQTHYLSRSPAYRRAFQVKPDTISEMGYMLFI